MQAIKQSRGDLIEASLPGPAYREDDVLTPRQRDILGHIARGRSNKQIAFALGIRERTVKFHVAALFERLGTQSRTEALVVALRSGVVSGRTATLFAGCGIVADSHPDREWDESSMKLNALASALGRLEP